MKCIISKKQLQEKYQAIKGSLNEKSRRLWCATEAKAIGKHGVSMVSSVTRVSPPTIYAGIRELRRKSTRKKLGQRVRKKGSGAKTILSKHPEVIRMLESLIEPSTKGDPMTPLQWVSKSLRNISRELGKMGYDVSHETVASLLKDAGYSLQLNRKEREGRSVPDRNAQFEHINERAKTFLLEGQPVISVDTKKKELVGNYKNWGREYTRKGEPVEVNLHDFPDDEKG